MATPLKKTSESDTSGHKKTLLDGSCVTTMSKYIRLFFNRKKKATATVAGAIEIVVCLQRERCYFHTGHSVTLGQWEDGMVVNHPRAVVINEEIQKKVTESNISL